MLWIFSQGFFFLYRSSTIGTDRPNHLPGITHHLLDAHVTPTKSTPTGIDTLSNSRKYWDSDEFGNFRPQLLESVAAEIAAFPEVSYLIMVSGEYDLMVEVMCENREELANFLNNKLRYVTGITRTQTSMVLRTYKMAYGAQPTLENPEEDNV